MIKNVIFDYGQVLVHFVPEYMVRQYVSDGDDVKMLTEIIFDRLYWDKLDDGTITNEQTVSEFKKRIPERLWEVSEKIFYNWIYNIPEMEGMSELVSYIKEKYGVKTYLLSNISHYLADHADEMPILPTLDGCVFSARIGKVKPTPAIYEHLLRTYSLEPSECIFIDDRAENIEGARALSIHGYIFDGDVDALRAHLDSVLK